MILSLVQQIIRKRKKIIIIGVGGHAKVVLDIIKNMNEYTVDGFLDDHCTDCEFCGYRVIGRIEDLDHDIDYIIGIGDVYTRQTIVTKYPNINFITVIHPTAIVSDTAIIDNGVVICAGAIIQTYAHIKPHCLINTNCNIDHESCIGEFTNISPSVTICGRVNIGSLCMIGANSTIIQNVKIGDCCVIGAGTIIVRNVPSSTRMMNKIEWKIDDLKK